jgi:hypothetical protein
LPLPVLLVFALTLFVSAFLLFLVQPMVGKMVTPLLGGTPAVWNTCMVFFQALLLAGYAYSHAATHWLGARKQAVLHLLVLLTPLAFFPLVIDRSRAPGADRDPVTAVLLLLTLSVGVPFLVVSTSAPLLQKWFASTDHPAARDPYFLYGASNLGSMLALLGYPTLVEPWLSLADQRWWWCVGYGVLAILAGACAVCLWLSRPAAELAGDPPVPEQPEGDRQATLGGDITPLRRLRWVILAAVPSSLMLGVTTYMTTDIAPIPLLWVLPLGLYLASFVVVFSRPSEAFQASAVGLGLIAVAASAAGAVPSILPREEFGWLRFTAWLACAACAIVGVRLAFVRDNRLLHRAFTLAVPPLILALLFLSLSSLSSEFGPKIILFSIALHLAAFFAVAMVCHGELNLDRPAPRYLTEFFLWMSVGGVLGGLVNGLLAPLLFKANVEYQLALVAACFLVPRFSQSAGEQTWRQGADVLLPVLLVLIGGPLLNARLSERDLDFHVLQGNTGVLAAVALLVGLVIGVGNIVWSERRSVAVFLDLALPLSLGLLVAGAYWGLSARVLRQRMPDVAYYTHLSQESLTDLLALAVPAVLCYTLAGRPVRFGLGVGALALTAAVCGLVSHPPVFQDRSFFGVSKVEKVQTPVHRGGVLTTYALMHGSTLHGMQFRDPKPQLDLAWRRQPLLYYHRTGPAGNVFEAYNTDATRPVGVIGLGAGALATYALAGQHFTFYEIDPVVRAIAFDTDRYFTYVSDARERGVNVDVVMGDARLTLEQQHPGDADKYGLFVVDAFSSDSIPVHLITREALRVYMEKTRADGLILFHITNRYVDLKPVLAKLAAGAGLLAYVANGARDDLAGKSPATWVVMARDAGHFARVTAPLRASAGVTPKPTTSEAASLLPTGRWLALTATDGHGVWTDDYSNLLRVFDWP